MMRPTEHVHPMIARHSVMQKVRELILRVAPTDATVLITGETGTGKELVARRIHDLSRRADHPFVPINCAAIPQELLESELFGHARGAFTGAVAPRPGIFQLANGGTLLLDEVGELPLALQGKLLRVLQDREVKPLGSDRATPVNVRVIASTNRVLEDEAARGAFRQDLFYRLQVIPITVPPLRARRSEIPLLVHHFLERSNRQHGFSLQVSTEALVHLWEYDWPGNVRQLENLVEQLVILNTKGRIEPEDLPLSITREASEKRRPSFPASDDGEGLDLRQAVEELESRFIDEAMRRSNGKKSAAAQLLRLKRTTLVAKLRRRSRARPLPGDLPPAPAAGASRNGQETKATPFKVPAFERGF